MEVVNVLVNRRIDEEYLRVISSVSPGVKLSDVSDLFQREQSGDLTAEKEFNAVLADAEVMFAFRLPKNLVSRAPRLKWVQVMSAGVDRFLTQEFRESPVVLTSVSGIHATPISEFVLGLMLMFVKQAPLCFRLKQEKQWKRFTPSVLRSKTVGVLGLGSIGREGARLAKAFGMNVMATRRSARSIGRARYVDIMLPPGELRRLLGESDFVVLALPLTKETRRLIGEEELRTMKPTAYLINIGRGSLVDEEALVRALQNGWIAGAGLDVFATEPLPVDSRLWELPNVIFSPHIAGNFEGYNIRATELFCNNLRRYLDGKRLLNVVDKNKGY